jgi:hypothetical protein
LTFPDQALRCYVRLCGPFARHNVLACYDNDKVDPYNDSEILDRISSLSMIARLVGIHVAQE